MSSCEPVTEGTCSKSDSYGFNYENASTYHVSGVLSHHHFDRPESLACFRVDTYLPYDTSMNSLRDLTTRELPGISEHTDSVIGGIDMWFGRGMAWDNFPANPCAPCFEFRFKEMRLTLDGGRVDRGES